ncbi:3-hydroxylacyl-ACP dehydratase [Alteromonas sp. C1M14]|uniref:ApeP family dehydratase n=1 Tax=Alteromonas sp. C1M14 TaxID=2841567 RepID=UPI001C09C488|nr:3-hydroxylacyl-ACP dehydratase [Alteromonas sp. C1M14]MBU2979669.1 3-hydroxylacyl-ACP dehydratase [Alteromonas sp. C1M14]
MTAYEVEDVLTHEAPMILINRLHSYTEESAQCEVSISETSPFFDPTLNGVPSHIGIEYMAQTIAAFAGANDLDAGREKKVGFLLGSRKYNSTIPVYKNGCSLQVTVQRLFQEESGLGVFDCHITLSENRVSSAKVNVFQPV